MTAQSLGEIMIVLIAVLMINAIAIRTREIKSKPFSFLGSVLLVLLFVSLTLTQPLSARAGTIAGPVSL